MSNDFNNVTQAIDFRQQITVLANFPLSLSRPVDGHVGVSHGASRHSGDLVFSLADLVPRQSSAWAEPQVGRCRAPSPGRNSTYCLSGESHATVDREPLRASGQAVVASPGEPVQHCKRGVQRVTRGQKGAGYTASTAFVDACCLMLCIDCNRGPRVRTALYGALETVSPDGAAPSQIERGRAVLRTRGIAAAIPAPEANAPSSS